MNALLINKNQHIATLTLNRPEVHNAFDDQLIAELINALQDLAKDETIRVLILAANGSSFSAGADLRWMQKMANYSQAENEADALELANLMDTLNQFPKPVIGKVQGPVFGGGVGLVACCDIVFVSERAKFCLSEVKLGLIPAAISPYVINAIGEAQARRYFLTAEVLDAHKARAINLVHEVFCAESLTEQVDKLAAQLCQLGPQAVTEAKKLIHHVTTEQDTNLTYTTAHWIAKLRVSAEGQEGLQAFLDKRKPNWINHD